MTSIIKKELRAYFTSMIGYVFLAFLVFMTALFFVVHNLLEALPHYNLVLSNVGMIFMILIPMLTMRLFAEEAKQKTDQLLYTSPVSVMAVVLGKYAAALLLFLIGMGITVIFPVALAPFGELPVAQITGAFVGAILLGACFISVGLFVSVLADNQIVAAVAAFAALFLLTVLDAVIAVLPRDRVSSLFFVLFFAVLAAYLLYDSTKSAAAGILTALAGSGAAGTAYAFAPSAFDGLIMNALGWFSLMARFGYFHMGILNAADVVYYVSFIALFLVFTIGVIEKRRWR